MHKTFSLLSVVLNTFENLTSCHDYEPLYATDRSHVVMKCNEHVDRLFFAPQDRTFSERPARFERDFLGAALPGREQRYGEASSRSRTSASTCGKLAISRNFRIRIEP